MGDFFYGWRRKAGCVTLVTALIFMGGWVRSDFVADSISWTSGTNTDELIMSAEQNLTWHTYYDTEGLQPTTLPVWNSSALDFTIVDDTADQPVWRWRLFGFEGGEFTTQMTGDSSHGLFCSIPYWSITVPLTLLSAFLLLRPGKRSAQRLQPNEAA